MITRYRLCVSSYDFVELNPDWTFYIGKKHGKSVARFLDGGQRIVRWNDQKSIKVATAFVEPTIACRVNAWWSGLTQLQFKISSEDELLGTSVTETHTVSIINEESPYHEATKKVDGTYKGLLELEYVNPLIEPSVDEVTGWEYSTALNFGYDCAISSGANLVLCGAPGYRGGGIASGAVYHYVGSWQPVFGVNAYEQRQVITASDTSPFDYFGRQVAISRNGTYLAISAPRNEEAGDAAGAIYIYQNSNNSFYQRQKLTLPDAQANDLFGSALAMSYDGVKLFATAPGRNGYRGIVSVWTRSGNSFGWTQSFSATDGASNDNLGFAISINDSATAIVAGAPGNLSSTGAAYVFTYSGGQFNQYAKLTCGTAQVGQEFGRSVVMDADGNRIAIGAPYKNYLEDEVGIVTVFDKSGGVWSATSSLRSMFGANSGFHFGYSLVLEKDNNNRLIVGATGGHASQFSAACGGFHYRSGTGYAQESANYTWAGSADDEIGFSMKADREWLIVGAPYFYANDAGRAALYKRYLPNSATTETHSPVMYFPVVAVYSSDPRSIVTPEYKDTVTTSVSGPINDWYDRYDGGFTRYTFNSGEEFSTVEMTNNFSGDQFGYAVKTNKDASVTVVGAPQYWRTFQSSGEQGLLVLNGLGSALLPTSGLGRHVHNEPDYERTGGAFIVNRVFNTAQYYATLQANSVDLDARYGEAVCIDHEGETVIVGAPYHNSQKGAAYLWKNIGGNWTEMCRAVDSLTLGRFGESVGISGNGQWGVVGVPKANVVRVFNLSGSSLDLYCSIGVGSLEAIAATDFGIGTKMSYDGKYLLIGTRINQSSGYGGQAYLLEINTPTSGFVNRATIRPTTSSSGDRFGISVAITPDADRIAVGATYAGSGGGGFVYRNPGSNWSGGLTAIQSTEVILTPMHQAGDSVVGVDIDISHDGRWVIMGGPWHPSAQTGASFVFRELANGLWTPHQELTEGAAYNEEGTEVAISGDSRVYVVGIPYGDQQHFTANGGIVAFRKRDGFHNRFGEGLATNHNVTTILVGAPHDSTATNRAGSVYAYDRRGSTWGKTEVFYSNDINEDDNFGASISMDSTGVWSVIGAPGKSRMGAAYIFERASGWIQRQKLIPPTSETYQDFGAWVAISGNGLVVAVGAPRKRETVSPYRENCGEVYIYIKSGGSFVLADTVRNTASYPVEGMNFGRRIAISETGIRISACGYSNETLLFHRSGNSWPITAVFSGELQASTSIDDDGMRVLCGEPFVNSCTGQIREWRFNGLDWEDYVHVPANASPGTYAGREVALTGDSTVFFASSHIDDATYSNPGQVYKFEFKESIWIHRSTMRADDVMAGDSFGLRLSAGYDGHNIVVSGNKYGQSDKYGAAFIF